MARKHAQIGPRRPAQAADGARTTTVEIELPGRAEGEETFATRTPTTEEIDTNAYSGPITVPRCEPLGETGIRVHPLALGAGEFGRRLDADAAADVLDRFTGVGGNLVVTADRHGDGRSESVLGAWFASRGSRDRVRLVAEVGRHPDHRGLAPRTIAAAVDASLARLGTDRIDLLCFRGDDPATPLEESLGAVDALIGAGKVLSVGASDMSPERLIEARVLAANGLPRFQVLAMRYNLMERRAFEGATELVAHAQGLAVLPYGALAGGFLGGAVRRRADLHRDPRTVRQARHLGRRGLRVLRVLDEIAAAHDTVPAAVAIAWLLARPTVTAPVAGASRPEQVDPLVAATTLVLQRSEIVELDRASA